MAITPDGGQYWGTLEGGLLHGRGRVEWRNGAAYSGSFANGLFSGKGHLRYSTGDVVEGDFEEGQPSGKISLTTRSGAIYHGQARLGQLEGNGRFQDGDNVYEGEFRNNLYHGHGHFVSPMHEYTGEFRQGQFWGNGELRQKNGRTYTGDFVRGEFEGKGSYTVPDGPVFEGDFVEGKLQGTGVVVYPNGAKQEGKFRDWRLDGQGRYIDADNNVFVGEFKGGQLTGRATVNYSDGSRYTGELLNWTPHGQGEWQLANGDVYRGGLRYGMYEGQGILVYAKAQDDGRKLDTGIWEYGRLKKQVEEEQRRTAANVELALYTQNSQLRRAIDELQAPSGNSINMYLLAVAGDGVQEVFRREVDFVRTQFEVMFGTQGHGIFLINSRNTISSNALATTTSIREAISAIAARMDKERDFLFLYLTGHGSKEGTLSLGLEGMRFPDLNAKELGALLKESGIRWKVVVISACYAGSFFDPLRDEGTLMIAAARADRRSFGCSDENDFTYFGRAFFKESIPLANSFEEAFAKASVLINDWEKRDGDREGKTDAAATAIRAKKPAEDRHSLPQIEAPDPVRQHLVRWRAQFPANELR